MIPWIHRVGPRYREGCLRGSYKMLMRPYGCLSGFLSVRNYAASLEGSNRSKIRVLAFPFSWII